MSAAAPCSAMSLKELSAWCTDLGSRNVRQDLRERDILGWCSTTPGDDRVGVVASGRRDGILEEIAVHAEANPSWFDLTYD